MNLSHITNKELDVKLSAKNKLGETVSLHTVEDPVSKLSYLAVAPVAHVAYDELNDRYVVDGRPEAKLIQEIKIDFLTASRWVVGENAERFSSAVMRPLNISKYKEKMIVIKSNMDTFNALINFHFYKDTAPIPWAEVPTKKIVSMLESESTLAPAKTNIYKNSENAMLDAPFPSMLIDIRRAGTPETSGEIIIQIFGR